MVAWQSSTFVYKAVSVSVVAQVVFHVLTMPVADLDVP